MITREKRRLEKRDFILMEAARLIYTQGYQSTSMKDIAAACDLGMNAIYSVFGSKEQICAELYLQAEKEFAEVFNYVLKTDKPLPEKNWDLARLYIEFYTKHNFLYEIVWLVLSGQLDSVLSLETVDAIQGLFVELLDGYSKLLEQLQRRGRIRADLDPRVMSATMWSMLSGLAANHAHRTQAITGVLHLSIRETELEMVLDYLQYDRERQGRELADETGG